VRATTLLMRLITCCLLLSLYGVTPAAEWPQWRGPDGQGHATAKNLPTEWSETKNVKWKAPIPGHGWSSPVISGNQIWLTTATDVAATPAEKKERLKENTGGQPLIVSSSVTMHAICIDRTTGKVLHDIEILKVKNPQWIHHLNSYASPSPILEDGRLYCAFGTYGTVCLDTKSAKVVWTNDELNIMHENGPGSTPVLSGDHLIMHCDGSDAQYVAALDKNTGKLAWKTARSGKMHGNPQLKKSYATPLVVKIGGRSQVISPGADWLYSYDPASGKELWKVPYGKLGFSIVPRPVVGHGMIFMCTSYMQSELLAIRYDTDKPAIAWRFKKQVPNRPSPVLVGDEIYMVSDKGVANCLNAKTGESHWTKRLGGGYSSSPLYADGKLFFLDQDGKTTVIKPGTKYEQLAVNQLADRIMASPAAVGSALYLRTEKSLYRIEK